MFVLISVREALQKRKAILSAFGEAEPVHFAAPAAAERSRVILANGVSTETLSQPVSSFRTAPWDQVIFKSSPSVFSSQLEAGFLRSVE
jgi:hypothetical protein